MLGIVHIDCGLVLTEISFLVVLTETKSCRKSHVAKKKKRIFIGIAGGQVCSYNHKTQCFL